MQKFQYVVACQVYGRMKKNQDPKADDIEMLLKRFPNLRVAYIDEVNLDICKTFFFVSEGVFDVLGRPPPGRAFRCVLVASLTSIRWIFAGFAFFKGQFDVWRHRAPLWNSFDDVSERLELPKRFD